MEHTVPIGPEDDPQRQQSAMPIGPGNRPGAFTDSPSPANSTSGMSPFRKTLSSTVTQTRQKVSELKRRQAAIRYALVCTGIIIVFLFLFISALGGFAHLFPPGSTVPPSPGSNSSTNNGGAVAVPSMQATTAATGTAPSGPTKITFKPVTVPSPIVAPGPTSLPTGGTTPPVGVTPTPTQGVTPTPTPEMTPTPGGTASVSAVLDCVIPFLNGSYTAYFGYSNSGPTTMTIPIGPNNRFIGVPANQGQPTAFSPGSRNFVVSVHSRGKRIAWALDGSIAAATANSTPCF
jgi:hypothetical protein